MDGHAEIHVALPSNGIDSRAEPDDARQDLPRRPEVIDREEHDVDEWRPAAQALHPRHEIATEVQLLDDRAEETIDGEVRGEGDDRGRLAVIADLIELDRRDVPVG